MKNHFILTPFFLDQALPGLESLAEPGWSLNNPALPQGTPQSRMSLLHEVIASEVTKAVKGGKRPVSIAGDCCTTIGVVAGLQRAGINPFVIWFDGHGDFNTWETTPSGFLGGMALSMLAGLGEQTMPGNVGLQSVPEEMIILTDGRNLDPQERDLIENSKVTHLTDVAELLKYPLPRLPLYIHVDVDIINPIDAPAMGYVAPGGPRASELEHVFSFLAGTGQITAVSMCTWTPELDVDKQSETVSMKLLQVLLEG
jgi:arginase